MTDESRPTELTSRPRRRVAILVDTDNSNPEFRAEIEDRARKYGQCRAPTRLRQGTKREVDRERTCACIGEDPEDVQPS